MERDGRRFEAFREGEQQEPDGHILGEVRMNARAAQQLRAFSVADLDAGLPALGDHPRGEEKEQKRQ
jgi:hypothetical protein